MTYLLILFFFLGALAGFLASCLWYELRPADADELRYRITPESRDAMEAEERTKRQPPVSRGLSLIDLLAVTPADEAASMDTGEKKAQAARAERRRRQRADNPEAFRPLVTNPDDPTDIVL